MDIGEKNLAIYYTSISPKLLMGLVNIQQKRLTDELLEIHDPRLERWP
jgi:hypothetical protein